ncbi:hypothetical protein PPL_11785 [Heterostelium album PN500]|uniref:Uncharacterized protein n=1 Tax=Heterostelium pallidum (strain ATCC 26659 / Pp 5 / PN500) TaxID=670386 RepID=D3BUG5_HETP5|nr:hypothetical protein PPL_11785 [Heterostelium album PN500]EFA74753.1 hypothetical protein PPL_11785 [Heterostelium album PN500]|eukprot:XP_020426887.1 hypothetical protein PPL_11785 [Heterostelium album PN500]
MGVLCDFNVFPPSQSIDQYNINDWSTNHSIKLINQNKIKLVNAQCDQCDLGSSSRDLPMGSVQLACPSNARCYQDPTLLKPPTCVRALNEGDQCTGNVCGQFLKCFNGTCKSYGYKGIGESCQGNFECMSSQLVCGGKGTCINPRYPICDTTTGCLNGERCVDGLCKKVVDNWQPCNASTQCRYLSVCQTPRNLLPTSEFDIYQTQKVCLPPFSLEEGDPCDVTEASGCNIDNDLTVTIIITLTYTSECYNMRCAKTHHGESKNCNNARSPMDKCTVNNVCRCMQKLVISDEPNYGLCRQLLPNATSIPAIALAFQDCFYSSGCPSAFPPKNKSCVTQKCGVSTVHYLISSSNPPCGPDNHTPIDQTTTTPTETAPLLTFTPIPNITIPNDSASIDQPIIIYRLALIIIIALLT